MAVLLRLWRERRGLSLRDLATRAGVAYSTLHRVEQGRMSPTVDFLEKLARALNVSVRDLIPAGWPKPRKGRSNRRTGR